MRQVGEHRDALLNRLPGLRLLFVATLLLIGSFYWFVQVVRGDYYRTLADNNRLRTVPIRSPRGMIFDREGRVLVENIPSYDLLLDRSRSTNLDAALEFAAGVVELPRGELVAALEQNASVSEFQPVPVVENLSLSEVSKISAAALEFPEFEVDVEHVRLYRHGQTTAHLLGYLSEVTKDELALEGTPYQSGDVVGRKGVERAFDLVLRGRDGERVVIVDSRGRSREEQHREPATAGRNIQLTIDLALQQEAARYFEGRVGAAVAMDPRNGELLALVSAPTYNPNLFSRRLERSEWSKLVEAPHDPLQNRAIQNAHSPGSVFKIVVATAGLTEGEVDEDDSVFCSGSTRIYGRRTRCWKPAGHGWVNLHSAMRESCDVYFYHLGQALGVNRIALYARKFGLGQRTGFEIPGERLGLVPDTEWSLRVREAPWYPGETISVAIGQGPILVTPLQIASAVATVARGHRVTPHVVAKSGTEEPLPVRLDARALAAVRKGLWAVVNEKGTGARARPEGLEIAGKTGTSQVVRQETWIRSEDLEYEKRDHAWFVAYGPVDDPQLVVVVFVEHGGHGSDAAAPLAKRMYESYFGDAGTG